MQQFQEASTWFPSNAECYSFHLSMRLQGHQEGTGRPFPSSAPQPVGLATNASAVSPSVMTPTSALSGFSIVSPVTESFPNGSALPPHAPPLPQHPQRIQLPRNNSFPPAGHNGRPTPRATAASSTNNSPPSSVATIPPSSDVEPKPSLVKHLQRIHGLTKKRNYGLQSSRVPFIRDETASALASAPYPPAPNHSVDPVNGRPRRNTGVHASKNKKGDDPRRPRRGSVHVILPESARVSSPDSDSSTSVSAPSPTTTTVAGVVASPTGPVSVGLQMAGTVPVSSPPLNLAEAAYATPSLWQNEALVHQQQAQQAQQQAQQAAAPANVAPAFTEQLASQPPALIIPAQVQAQVQAQPPQTHMRGAGAPPGSSSSSYSNMPHGNPDSPVAYSTSTAAAATTSTAVRSSSFVSQPSASLNNTTPSVIAPVPAAAPTTDDGDKPFIFYPEYEDALMPQALLFASLPAATQPTPMTQFWYDGKRCGLL